MDQQFVALLGALFIFLGVFFLFLYSWQAKQGWRLPWKAFALCSLVACGTAFAAGFFLANMADSTSYALANALQLDQETSARAAKLAINLTAILAASTAGLWVARKTTH